MRNVALLAVLFWAVSPVLADWPGHVIKWDQLDGLDNFAAASWMDYDTPSDALTADDYWCDGRADHRYVTDLEFWGFSYYGSSYIDQFRVNFWTDMPSNPNDQSHPADLLYSYDVYPADPGDPLKIGWQEIEPNHFKIDLPQDMWFDQGVGPGRTLWVSIQGVMVTDGYFDAFYWYFRERHLPTWGDDAAFSSEYFGYPPWYNWGSPAGFADPDLYDGPLPADWTSLDMAFNLTCTPEPLSLLMLGLCGLMLRRR
jgi:hypothetical protein